MNSDWSYSSETKSGQNWQIFVPYDLEIFQMTLENNRAPRLCYFKLCALFISHVWIETWITVRKRPNWGKTRCDLCDLTLDLRTWLFAWTSLLSMVISIGNSWWYDERNIMKKVSQTDRRTDRNVLRAAWSQLKSAIVYMRIVMWLSVEDISLQSYWYLFNKHVHYFAIVRLWRQFSVCS